MKSTRIRRVALIVLATLPYSLPSRAQAPDARAGAVIVETQKPVRRAAPAPVDTAGQAIVVVGARGRHAATPRTKAGADTTATTKSAPPRAAGHL